jgi:hypothetical protein
MSEFLRRDVTILISTVFAVIALITLMPAALVVREGFASAFWIVVILCADLVAFWGVYRLFKFNSTVALWFAFGANFRTGIGNSFCNCGSHPH